MSTRDRMKDPSINWPETEEEAFQAILLRVRKSVSLDRTYTTDSGLGTTRSQEQADWLNAQQSLIKARIEDLLDQLDITNRIH